MRSGDGVLSDVRLENMATCSLSWSPSGRHLEINFSGNKSIDSDKLKEGLKDIGLAEGRTFEHRYFDRIEQELRTPVTTTRASMRSV